MADLSKTIAIIFSGVDELSGPMANMSKKLNSFGNDLQSMGAPLDAAAMNILKIDAALAALAAGGLAYAFNASMKFENAAIELKKVMGDGLGTDQAIGEATRLSEIYGESAADILLSSADFKQAGYDINDSLLLTKDSMDLVIAGNIEAAESSNIIIAALKGFGEEADSARKFVDILNEVSNNYATDVEQLAVGMAAISPIANQMGFSMEETAGLLTPVIEIFRSGDEAANALKTGLLKLVDNTKPVQDSLAAMGISQKNVNGSMKSGKDIYLEVATAFQGLTKEEKIYHTQNLTGIHQSAKMVTVFDNLALATKITETAMNSAGSAAKEVAERLKSDEISVKLFTTSFENLSITIGDQFRLAAKEAIDGGTDIERSLRDMVKDGTFDSVFDALNTFSTDIGTFLSQVAKDLPEAFKGVKFDSLIDATGDVGEALKGMFADFDLTTPEGLTKAIEFVVESLESLASTSTGIIESLSLISNSAIKLMETFNGLNPEAKELVGNALGLGTVLVTLGGIVGVGGILLGGIGTLAGMLGSGGALAVGITAAKASLTALMAHPAFAPLAAGALGWAIGGQFRKLFPIIDEYTLKMFKAADSVVNFSGQAGNVDLGFTKDNLDGVADAADNVALKLYEIPDRKTTEWSLDTTGDDFIGLIEKVDKIPESKMMEIQLKGDVESELAKIKTAADTLQSSMEWSAKLNIAGAQADAQKIKSAFDAIGASVSSVADATGTMFSSTLDNWEKLKGSDQNDFMDLLEDQTEQQDKLIETQTRLTDAQAAYMEEKTRAMQSGEGLIKISGDGLGPALEMVLFEIAELMQVRMLEEQSEFLLTVPT